MAQWCQDSIMEIRFKDDGFESFEWRDRINLNEVDIKGSLKNNARQGDPLDDDNTMSIGEAISNDQPLPGPVLRKVTGKKLLYVLGGNHRIAGVQLCSLKTFGGYVVVCSDLQAELFTRVDNRNHGKRTGYKECIESVYFLHTERGMSVAALAKKYSFTKSALQAAILARKLREELNESHISVTDLSDSTLIALNPLHHDAALFVKAVQIAVKHKIPSSKAILLSSQVNESRNPAMASNILDEWERDEEKNTKRKQSAAAKKGTSTTQRKRAPTKTRLLNMIESRTGIAVLLRNGNRGKPVTHINNLGFEIDEARTLVEAWDEIERRMAPLMEQARKWVNQEDHENGKTNATVSSRGQKKAGRKRANASR